MIKRLRDWWYYRKHPERKVWERWKKKGGQCPYCVGLGAEDWLAVCDCWEAERVLEETS